MILRQNLQFARDLEGDDDQYGSWRLDVDDMSYEVRLLTNSVKILYADDIYKLIYLYNVRCYMQELK